MKVSARLKNVSVSERKARLVAGLVRGSSVVDADRQLRFLNKKSAALILGLLRSAVANAEHNDGLEKDSLKIHEITVDGAGMMRRYQPRAFGRAYPIRRRRCHINLTLEGTPAPKKKSPKKKSEKKAPVASGDKKKDSGDTKKSKKKVKSAA